MKIILFIALAAISLFNTIATMSKDRDVKDIFYAMAISLTALLAFMACYMK